MADPVGTASTKSPHHLHRETQAAGAPLVAGDAASFHPAFEERARLALDDTESAARLLENAFVSLVERNELSMPAVEQLYAALEEVEVAVTVLEARLPQGHRLGGS